jgi:hypothetical protein
MAIPWGQYAGIINGHITGGALLVCARAGISICLHMMQMSCFAALHGIFK